jgi:hypothetical protein
MGQQQLLYIILGVIFVGLAVAIGIILSSSNAKTSNRDAMVEELTNMGALARTYYEETINLGGGNQTFTGWTIPASMATSGSGSFSASVSAQQVILTGIGSQTGTDGINPVKVLNYVTPSKDSIVISN